MSKADWMNSLTASLARDQEGNVIGVQWFVLTLTSHVDRLPESLREAATEMLQHNAKAQSANPRRELSGEVME